MPLPLKISLSLALATSVLVASCANPAGSASAVPQAFEVDVARSEVLFVTTKAGLPGVGGISEVQSFKRFAGGLSADGRVSFDVDLASVDTGIGIRDDRMRSMLFNVAVTPRARFTGQIDPALTHTLPIGGSSDIDVAGSLTLAGQTQPVAARLRLTRLAGDALQVSTRLPIVVDANQFGLKAGVEALREVVNLNFLASSAPVTFALVLNARR